MSVSKERARELIAKLKIGDLITINDNGMPVDRAMYTPKVDDDLTVYFATAKTTSKIGHLEKNPGVVVVWPTGDGYISLIGRAVVTDEQSVRDYIWEDSFKEYFPQGKEDPTYIVIKISPISMSYYECGMMEQQAVELG